MEVDEPAEKEKEEKPKEEETRTAEVKKDVTTEEKKESTPAAPVEAKDNNKVHTSPTKILNNDWWWPCKYLWKNYSCLSSLYPLSETETEWQLGKIFVGKDTKPSLCMPLFIYFFNNLN